VQAAIETKRSGMPSPDEAQEATPQGRAEQGRVGQCAAKSLCWVLSANLRHHRCLKRHAPCAEQFFEQDAEGLLILEEHLSAEGRLRLEPHKVTRSAEALICLLCLHKLIFERRAM